jgi:hypothetical protein
VKCVTGTKRLRLRLDVVVELDALVYHDLPVDTRSTEFTAAVIQAADAVGAAIHGFVRVDTIDYDVRADRRPLKNRKKDG